MSLKRHDEDEQIETSQEQQLSPKPNEEVIISEKTGLPEIRKKLQEPTAVPQAESKQQTAPQKSSPPTQAKPKKEEKFYFTLEMLHRDVQRIKNQSQQKSRRQEATVVENKKKAAPIPELDAIETWATELTEEIAETSDDAKRDERVMLMATSVIKMCQLLRNFSEVMTAEMAKHAERELQNLNIQNQYAKSVKASTVEVTRDIYHQFKAEQEETFRDVQKYLCDSCDDMEREINACTAEVKKTTALAFKAARNVSATTRKLRRVKTFGDLMYYAAPLFVVIDIIIRVIALVGHFG